VGISITVKDGEALKRLRKLANALSPQQRARHNQRAAIQLHTYVMRVFAHTMAACRGWTW
jgi:hypothetical protein